MSGGCTRGALRRSQFASRKGRQPGHRARPSTRRPHGVERPMMRRVLTALSLTAAITPLSASTAFLNDAFSEPRHV